MRKGRIARAFAGRKAFIGYLTAGDPSLEQTLAYIRAMADAGADIIEIGVPFSDPIAEGPVIQAANIRALQAGATLDKVFELVHSLRSAGCAIPLLLLTYLNPVFRYGYQRFFAACARTGVDGVIIPDLPFDERGELSGFAAAQAVDIISMVAPTSDQRVIEIACEASGYIYLVSSLGVTGMRDKLGTDAGDSSHCGVGSSLAATVDLIRGLTDVPVAVGFGVHTPAQAGELAQVADGVIVGSAIVDQIAADPQAAARGLADYVRSMKAGMAM
jgi:tryptophan synthase alpha chain